MDFSGFDLAPIKQVFDLFRTAVGAVKDVKDLLPKPQQEVVTRSLEEAEKAARIAEAAMAKALGYELCQCTFPPQIMLEAPGTRIRDSYDVRCPSCNQKRRVSEFVKASREGMRRGG